MKKKIIFVCTGNTCRSPMAEIIMKNKLKLAGVQNIRVTSAGLSAVLGDKISKNSALALKQLGYKSYGFKSKPLTKEMVIKADLIICMTESHKRYLSGFENVYTVSELTGLSDIIDPYGGSLAVYKNTAYQIDDACNILLEKILEVEGE